MVLRAGLAAVCAALLSSSLAGRAITGMVDGIPICYEDHPSRTVMSYVEGGYEVHVLDANKSGVLDDPRDRVVVFFEAGEGFIRHVYYHDGVLETRIFERDSDVVFGPDVFFGPYYREGNKIFDTVLDREGYEAARERFKLDTSRLELGGALEHKPHVRVDTCDPYGVFGDPANRF